MSIWRLVLREIAYRKLTFGLAVLAATLAVASVVAAVTLLRLHDRTTDDIMRRHEDEIRKITLQLGFNILILPKDQNLADLYAEDFASKYMPEDYARKLIDADVVTIKHLLPSLQERVVWQEAKRTVLLFGTRGELDKRDKKPLLDAVPPGKLVLGHELHQALGAKKGDRLTLSLTRRTPAGDENLEPRQFIVHDVRPARGNKDDITLWINLAEAQKILKRDRQINALLALECDCSAQRLANVREEIARVLPDTQVIEYHSQALARAEARNQAAARRAEVRDQHEAFAAVLVPLVTLGCIVLLGVLAFLNVADRLGELGILRALGVGARQLCLLFLGRAFVVGLLGGLVGFAVGLVSGTLLGEAADFRALDLGRHLSFAGLVLLMTPSLCCLASLLPALRAARQDPAVVLQQDL